ncbi:MAG: cobalamin B12-binding domain-containing protein [Oscillospiraceae bacterium]
MDARLGEKLVEAMRDLNEKGALQLSLEMLENGISSYEIFEYLMEGMGKVINLYEKGEYFIADLMMAGHAMTSVLSKVLNFYEIGDIDSFGRVMIATVKDDIHGLGKDMIANVLRHNCFEVVDLGVDVSAESIVKAVREKSPDMLLLSGSLSNSPERMKESISALREAGLRDSLYILVGGQAVTKEIADSIGADAYSADLMQCLKLCYEFMAKAIKGVPNE